MKESERKTSRGHSLAWQTHSTPTHWRKPSWMASFQGLKGPSVFFKPWMGRGARLKLHFLKTTCFEGKFRKLILFLLYQKANRSLKGERSLPNLVPWARLKTSVLCKCIFPFKHFVWKNFRETHTENFRVPSSNYQDFFGQSVFFFPWKSLKQISKNTLFCLKIFPRSVHLKDAAIWHFCPSVKGEMKWWLHFYFT